ncbi:PEP-CTERM sorting domain-containing protein [Simiduia agarivorans]|uniref:PEP-CTERM protein-sorting domain-containing protein n=1 Tax=Simiduia agarivorans (strain DSM 21679 / JCM 13881 / BCRC 17597 / SA1) TaxID=1117647 RepID=K4KM77_SIMAS|nr:PEP-CTERM sorting domain-containing protein [Simiduia agarivorans]AFV00132.1 hypothetical protein M5M_14985 [Simiduia agarivorans SA1 = DSM 21679]
MFTHCLRLLVAGFSLVLAAQAGAYQITTDQGAVDVGGLDILKGQMQKSGNANPATEEAWAEGVLGLDLDFGNVKTETVDYYMTDANNIIAFALASDPGFYIIKNAKWFALFENTASLGWGVVDIGALSAGFNLKYNCDNCSYTISHVTEFNSWQTSVSEPGSALLMLLGVIGLWAGRRQQRA